MNLKVNIYPFNYPNIIITAILYQSAPKVSPNSLLTLFFCGKVFKISLLSNFIYLFVYIYLLLRS